MGGSKLVQKSYPKRLFEKYNQLKGEEITYHQFGDQFQNKEDNSRTI